MSFFYGDGQVETFPVEKNAFLQKLCEGWKHRLLSF